MSNNTSHSKRKTIVVCGKIDARGTKVMEVPGQKIFKLHYPTMTGDAFDFYDQSNEEQLKEIEPYNGPYPMTYRSHLKNKLTNIKQRDELCRINAERINKYLNSFETLKNRFLKTTLAFRCHFEEHQRRTEVRRRKAIKRLQGAYHLSLSHLRNDVADRVITFFQNMEKQKWERERLEIQKKISMISRLLKEQERKRRGAKKLKIMTKPKKALESEQFYSSVTEGESVEALHTEEIIEEEPESKVNVSSTLPSTPIAITARTPVETKVEAKGKAKPDKGKKEKEQTNAVVVYPTCGTLRRPKVPCENVIQTELAKNIEEFNLVIEDRDSVNKKPKPFLTETALECVPSPIIFENYSEGKSFYQVIKVTNIGLDNMQCRFVGVEMEDFGADSTLIKVPVSDQVWLGPGLTFSTKVKFKSPKAEEEVKGHLIYETRRKKRYSEKSHFYIPFHCIPQRAEITISPLAISFPHLTWCKARSEEGLKLLRRRLKITNTGGKACFGRISSESLEELAEKRRALWMEGEDEEVEMAQEEWGGEDFQYCLPPFNKISLKEAYTVLEELLDNVFSVFQFNEKYFFRVPPFSTKEVDVLFRPKYKGVYAAKYYLQFEDCHNCTEEILVLSGGIKRIPIHSNPVVVDLNTCVINSGVYQGTFKVINESPYPYPVTLTLPKCLQLHATVFPVSTVIQGVSASVFSVKFHPRLNILSDANRYFDQESGILEFPISVHGTGPGTCWADKYKIYIMAVVSNYALELSPSFIDFENVTTLETVHTVIQLTNHSLSIQEYGFLNLSPSIRLEPNMGFGKILPGETIPIHVLYSPYSELMEGNPLGLPGLSGKHEFEIKVSTIAEIGGFKEKPKEEKHSSDSERMLMEDLHLMTEKNKRIRYKNFDDFEKESTHLAQEIMIKDSLEIDVLGEEEAIEESIPDANLEEAVLRRKAEIREYLKRDSRDSGKDSLLEDSDDESIEEFDLKTEETLGENEDLFYQQKEVIRKDDTVIFCRATISDTLCELSDTVIQLPATPCSSFSLTRFHLFGFNRSTSVRCYCGLMNRLIDKSHVCKPGPAFEAWFEFQFFCPHIKLEPQSGEIKQGEDTLITIVFRPEFPANDLRHESRIQKTEKQFEEKKLEEERAASAKPAKGAAKASAKDKGVKAPNQDVVDEIFTIPKELQKSDIFAGEKSLKELMIQYYIETKIQCIINILMCDGQTKRSEVHNLFVIAPIIKPSFITLGDSEEIRFGKVPIGTRPKIVLEIQNIVLKPINPTISILNPVGPFSCPIGSKSTKVDPEHVWRQPITYSPTHPKGLEVELFDVRSGPTTALMKVSGEGVKPDYYLLPEFRFYRFESKPKSFVEFKIEFQNRCEAILPLQLVKKFEKEGNDVEPVVLGAAPASKKEPKKEKPLKMLPEMTPELIKELENDFPDNAKFEYEGSPEIFTVFGLEQNNEINVLPFTTVSLKLRFTPAAPPPLPKGAKPPPPQGEQPAKKKYAARYEVMLGRIFKIAEFVLFGNLIGDGKGKK